MRFALSLFAVITASQVFAAGQPVDIPGRAKGADTVIVGTVLDVDSSWRSNKYGDRLIVSRATVLIEETIKGRHTVTSVDVDVEGGTIGELSLKVSDMPTLTAGERAAFFLARGEAGVHVPHLRGLGILKLDKDERVPGSSLTLQEIRRLVRGSKP